MAAAAAHAGEALGEAARPPEIPAVPDGDAEAAVAAGSGRQKAMTQGPAEALAGAAKSHAASAVTAVTPASTTLSKAPRGGSGCKKTDESK